MGSKVYQWKVLKQRRESFRRLKKKLQRQRKNEQRLQCVMPGVYRHYAGKLYYALFTARQTETGEELVIYLPLYAHLEGGHVPQARPLSMWFDLMPTKNDPRRTRFTNIGMTLPKGTKAEVGKHG